LQHHLFTLLLKTSSNRAAFLFVLRGTRIVFLLLKRFFSELETEVEVILTLPVKLSIGD
jgi:Guanine nucleotide exchange factor in Golgi transport N-terminal